MVEIIPHSNARRSPAESVCHRPWAILSLFLALANAHAATAQSLNVMISTETAPPGATVQIKFSLDKPAAVASGELALDLDPAIFGPVTAIATFSAAGDGSGFATVNGSHLDIHFQSPSGTLGSAAGVPLVVITVPILATANAGTQAMITADATGSPWSSSDGTAYAVSVTSGSVTIGGSLSVSDVSPISNLAAGAVVHISGGGFTSATTVDIAAVSVVSVKVIGPHEIDATLAGPADLGGKRITVSNPGGSQVTFFAAPPATPLASIGDVFDGALPLFPTASYLAGGGAYLEGVTFGRMALVNPNPSPVDVLLQVRDPVGYVGQMMTLAIPAGSAYNNDFRSLNANGKTIDVIATAPLRMLQLLGHPDNGNPASFYQFIPFEPMSIQPLGVSVGYGASAQLTWVTGGPPPQPQSVIVYPSQDTDVGFKVSFSTATGGDWLSVTPASGRTCHQNLNCAAYTALTVTASPSGLEPGIYRGTVTVTPIATEFQPAGPPVSFPVALTVTAAPLINHIVSRAIFSVSSYQSTLSSTVPITPDMLPGAFTVDVVTDSGTNWLSATPLSGTTPAQLQLAAAPGNLGPGIYTGVVTVHGSGGNVMAIESTLTLNGGVLLGTGTSPVFALGPGGPPSGPQTVPVQVFCSTNCSPSGVPNQVTWTTTVSTHSGGNWLSAESSFNSTGPGGSVTISVNPGALAAGLDTGAVTLTSDQAAPLQIPVALNLWSGPVPALFAVPAVISLNAAPFAAPVADAADLCTTTSLANVQQTAQASTSNGSSWLSVTVTNDVTGSCGIRLSLNASHLDAGVYRGTVTISVPGQTLDVPLTLTIPPPATRNGYYQPVLGSVLNGASAVQGAIAPGEIITIRGFGLGTGGLPVDLTSSEVLIDGKPAPVLYASPSQINAIVPYEAAGKSAASLQVLFQGSGSQIWSVPVALAAPGIFTLDATGAGPAAVLNQDNSVNGPTQPAARGSVIQIFATGIPVRGAVTGGITPAAAPGSTDPVSVTIGGLTASVLYAGPAPGEIAGLVQVNAVVSDLAPTGPAVPIVLSVSSAGRLGLAINASQIGATLAVQ